MTQDFQNLTVSNFQSSNELVSEHVCYDVSRYVFLLEEVERVTLYKR